MLKKRFFRTKDEVEVTFELEGNGVESAELVLETEKWEPIPMKQRKSDSAFVARVRLPLDGSYQFRYRLNGSEWENDAEADAYWPNEYGSENSVVFTSKN